MKVFSKEKFIELVGAEEYEKTNKEAREELGEDFFDFPTEFNGKPREEIGFAGLIFPDEFFVTGEPMQRRIDLTPGRRMKFFYRTNIH